MITVGIGAIEHGTEFVERENLPALTNPFLPEYHRPFRIQPDRNRNKQHDRQKQNQEHERNYE